MNRNCEHETEMQDVHLPLVLFNVYKYAIQDLFPVAHQFCFETLHFCPVLVVNVWSCLLH